MDEPNRLNHGRALFICLSVGELLRLLALAILGGSFLSGVSGGLLLQGAWLLLFLAPHAAIASAFLHVARSPRALGLALWIVMPAKAIGILAGATIFGRELAGESPTLVRLWLPESSLPVWFLLAIILVWDAGVLAALAVASFEARESARAENLGPRPAATPVAPAASVLAELAAAPKLREADSLSPVFHDSDVEAVDEGPATKPSG